MAQFTGAVMKGSVTEFASQMKKMINNKDTSDVRFLIGPNRKAIYAHKCILVARCEVFRAVFDDHNKNNSQVSHHDSLDVPLVLSDADPEIFMAVMEYIYANCVTLNTKIAIETLGSALEYGLEGLCKLCISFLNENTNFLNACEIIQASVTYGQDSLREKTMIYVEENTGNVFKTKGFHELSEEALFVVLQSDNLIMDEMDIISAVREWAKVNSVVRNTTIQEVSKKVMRQVRLPLLSPEELAAVEKNYYKEGLMPSDMMSYAWKVHALKKGDSGNVWCRKRRGTLSRDCHHILDMS